MYMYGTKYDRYTDISLCITFIEGGKLFSSKDVYALVNN